MFDSDSEGDAPDALQQLTINEHYAKAFEYKKEREELDKLKAKYGSDFEEHDLVSETDSESLESEDEDGEELTPAMDAAIFRTLAKIKRKDPEIYKPDTPVFEEEKLKTNDTKPPKRVPKEKSKPVTLRQVALDSVLNPTSRSPSPAPLTHVEEQRHLRAETIAAFHQAVSGVINEDDDDDDLLIPRSKTKDEIELQEEEYRAFLEREVGPDLDHLVTIDADVALDDSKKADTEDITSSKSKKKKAKSAKAKSTPKKSKEEEDREFLMNYILNRGWIDRENKRVPTYGDIVSPSKGKGKEIDQNESEASGSGSDGDIPQGELDEDDFDEVAEVFETSYNFRFEEPGAAVIQGFPRNIASTVRRDDSTRKEARQRKKERKEAELSKKKEEIKRLKALKMKEIRAKLERIGKEGGKDLDNDAALQDLDLDGDWDPEAHDQQMAGLYGEDDADVDAEKPSWDDDIDIGDIPMEDFDDIRQAIPRSEKKKKKKKNKKEELHEEDGVDLDDMDADVEQDEEEWDGTEEMRKRKLDEYMDEVYGLDINGMVGDMPTRFKYVPVQTQNFALTPAEILMATDAELNEFMSIKRYAPYRTDAKKWDAKRNERLQELKRRIAQRTGKAPDDGFTPAGRSDFHGVGDQPVKKRKGKKERMKLKATVTVDTVDPPINPEPAVKEPTKSKRKRDEADVSGDEVTQQQTAEISEKKRKRRHKKKEVSSAA